MCVHCGRDILVALGGLDMNYIDNNNNLTVVFSVDEVGNTVSRADATFHVVALVGVRRGYITDAKFGDIFPGPCLTWWGEGESYPDWVTALEVISGPVAWRYSVGDSIEVKGRNGQWTLYATGPHVDGDLISLREAGVPREPDAEREYVRLYIDSPRMLVDIEYSDENLPCGSNWQVCEKAKAEQEMAELLAQGWFRGHENNPYS